jgi:hypothetical protein
MSNPHTKDRGNLFENAEKKKPSQPDCQGDCTIDGTAYEISAWRRDDQLVVSLAPPRGDRNTYPAETFKGSLEAPPPVRGKRDAEAAPTPAWTGDITSTEAAYTVRAFPKQGKSGSYFTLSFERLEKRADDADSMA